jgi:APA family basic amino acid/polyamine antiporter
MTDTVSTRSGASRPTTLVRDLGLLALVATALCNVIGGGINVLSVGIQQKVPGIGPYVPLAFLIGVLPALFAALCYAVLSSAMPRAGGGYIYVSRGLHPFVGFMATFSKWFGLAAAIGVISYIDVALLASGIGYLSPYLRVEGVVVWLTGDAAKVIVPLAMIWLFWLINVLGVRTYGWTVIVLMTLMLLGGVAIIVTGFLHRPQDYAAAFAGDRGTAVAAALAQAGMAGKSMSQITAHAGALTPGGLRTISTAAAWLFFAYVGFAGISQAGGEARNPQRTLPRAFVISTTIICGYYLLFSSAVYHAIPWRFVAGFVKVTPSEASVPLLIGLLMPPALASFVALMAALALANDIPPMLMATSRLFFAWARDGVFPRRLAAINRRFHTPHWALTACALVSSAYALACYMWNYFAAIDTVVVALMFTYLLVSITVLTLPRRSPEAYRQVAFIRSRPAQVVVAWVAALSLIALLVLEFMVQDRASLRFWLGAMATGAVIFIIMWTLARRRGEDLRPVFAALPVTAEDLDTAPPGLGEA